MQLTVKIIFGLLSLTLFCPDEVIVTGQKGLAIKYIYFILISVNLCFCSSFGKLKIIVKVMAHYCKSFIQLPFH